MKRKLASIWADPKECEAVEAQLSRYGDEPHEREPERVRLAVLKLSNGQKERVAEFVKAAKRDFRDVLMWAEYPAEGQALWALRRDLTEEERRRLEELRHQDRDQYRRWLEDPSQKNRGPG